MSLPIDTSKERLKKHVAAIHVSGELSLVERKLSNVLLLNAYDDLLTVRTHRIRVTALMVILGWDEGKNVTALRAALRKLATTAIDFNVMGDANEPWGVATIISFAEIEDGWCTYRYDEAMAARLFDPIMYATVNLGVQRKFAGSYTLALYENCLRYAKVGSTGWLDLNVLRRLLGASQEYYDDFRRLNSKVIQKAVAEVNKVSDIQVEAELRKQGRSVVAVRFLITQGPQPSLLTPETVDEFAYLRDTPLFKRLRDHGIGEKLALSYMIEDEGRARTIVAFTEEKHRRGEIKSSTGGYIKKLMDERAEVGESKFEAQRRVDGELAAARTQQSKEQTQQEDARGEFIRAQTVEAIRAMTMDEKRQIARRFLESDGAKFAGEFREDSVTFKGSIARVNFSAWLNTAMRPAFDEAAFASWLEQRRIKRN
jgi:hypothetical protein